MTLLEQITQLEHFIGNTPLLKLNGNANTFAKMEYLNFMGSIKDRPAYFILRNAIARGLVGRDTTIIESTSGNFGIALAGICRRLKLRFIPVIDPNITAEKAGVLKLLSHSVVTVEEPDQTGGYLLNRIKKVKELLEIIPDSYHPNQYENEDNFLSYYHGLGPELCKSLSRLDYVFVSVSSGGTVTGLSLCLKEKFPNVNIVAVDVEGSLIFQNKAFKSRKISGLGSSIRTSIIDKALIDDTVILSQQEIVKGCQLLLQNEGILAGASSGAAYFAQKLYNDRYHIDNAKNVNVIIMPDSGNAYVDSIYNPAWVGVNIHLLNYAQTGSTN
jgi:2,3-diaminopropionate biosynthesis protein SbnA